MNELELFKLEKSYTINYLTGCEVRKVEKLFFTKEEAEIYIKNELPNNYTEPYIQTVKEEIANFEELNEYDPTGENNFKDKFEYIKAVFYWIKHDR